MEFKRLADVEILESATDEANVLIEEGGEVKRVPKTEVGGTGFPTAIIKDSLYDNALAGVSTMSAVEPAVTFECINMTFEEAYEIMASGGVLNAIGMLGGAIPCISNLGVGVDSGAGIPCLVLFTSDYPLFWTADGLSTEMPSSGE